jgi:putative iron-regulated protein
MIRHNIYATIIFSLILISCKKHTDNNLPAPQTAASTPRQILTDIATNVIYGVNLDIYIKTVSLDSAVLAFVTNPTTATLDAAKSAWYEARKRYELSEAVVFGPSVYEGIDPDLDSWPIDTTGLNTILNGSDDLTAGYVANLNSNLKGYHIIEFLLFGSNGQKTTAQFSARQLQFLPALTADARTNALELKSIWNPSEGNYVINFSHAGSDSSAYSTQNAAFQELVGNMQLIADQIANTKILGAMNPSPNPALQESEFSNNTLSDLINNVQGISNVYFGKYLTQGKGIHDWVAPQNATLDSTITAQLNAASNVLSSIPCSFTDAIYPTSPCNAQLKNAQTIINELSLTLKNQLTLFVNQTIQN